MGTPLEGAHEPHDDVFDSRALIRVRRVPAVVEHDAFTPPADHVPVVRVERQSDVEEILLTPDDQVANTLDAFATAVESGQLPVNDGALRQAVLVDDIRTRARLFVDHTTDRVG